MYGSSIEKTYKEIERAVLSSIGKAEWPIL
jgi:hypothetical protein